jgi:hypothetical protein
MSRALTEVDDDFSAGHRWVAWYEHEGDDSPPAHAHYVAYGKSKEIALERLEKLR